jgi:hypothetical protein
MAQGTVMVDATTSRFHLSWGAVFAGVSVALGVGILLHSLGLAAGLTAINPDNPGSLRGVGIGTGIWTIIVPLIALFAGGFVAARTAGLIDRGTGALHGAVLWGLTTVAGSLLVWAAIASAIGPGMQAGRMTLGAAARAAAGSEVTIDASDILGPINQRLLLQGAPPVTVAQLEEATREVVGRAVREGRMDHQSAVGTIVAHTGLDGPDAERLAARIEAQFNQSVTQFRHGALVAAETTGKVLWAVFAALLLGLASSVAGAIVGVSRRQREAAELVTPHPDPVPPSPRRILVENP